MTAFAQLLYVLFLLLQPAHGAHLTHCSFNSSKSYLDAIHGGSLDAIIMEARRELKKIARVPTMRDRKVVFTHVPKSAGTSVKMALKSWNRFHSKGHVPFNLTDVEFNHSALHFTIMRKPSSRVISLFAYINMFPHLNQNYCWNETHEFAKKPLEWIKLPKIQEFLSQVSVKYFGNKDGYDEIFASATAFRQSWLRHPAVHAPAPAAHGRPSAHQPPPPPLSPADRAANERHMEEIVSLAPDLPDMRDRLAAALCLKDVPESMRCEKHAEVILTLLNRYSVVGILEDYSNIWKVMADRVGLPDLYKKLVSDTTRNTHTQSKKSSTETPLTTNADVKKAFEIAIQDILFCENMVYEVSQRIHEIDLAML